MLPTHAKYICFGFYVKLTENWSLLLLRETLVLDNYLKVTVITSYSILVLELADLYDPRYSKTVSCWQSALVQFTSSSLRLVDPISRALNKTVI